MPSVVSFFTWQSYFSFLRDRKLEIHDGFWCWWREEKKKRKKLQLSNLGFCLMPNSEFVESWQCVTYVKECTYQLNMHRTSDHKSIDALELSVSLPPFYHNSVCLICWWMTCINNGFFVRSIFLAFTSTFSFLFSCNRFPHSKYSRAHTTIKVARIHSGARATKTEKKNYFYLKEKITKDFF